MKLNPKEAPKGYIAVPAPDPNDCTGCKLAKFNNLCVKNECSSDKRKDGNDVIFVKNPKSAKVKFSFKKVPDAEVRTVWKNNEGELVYLYPCDIADTGVPISEDGEDCEYLRTEIIVKTNRSLKARQNWTFQF